MIRIFKDNDVKVVTNGVYNQLYKPLGYKPVIEEEKPRVVVQTPKDEKPQEPKEIKQIKESSKPHKRNRGE